MQFLNKCMLLLKYQVQLCSCQYWLIYRDIKQNFNFWNIKYINVRIIGVPEGEEREKGPKKIFEEIIVEKFPNMGKEIATQVQETQRVPYRINPRRNTSRHIVIKLTKIKDKEKLLKTTREKRQITYKGTPIRLTADFSAETLQARRSGTVYI